MRRFEFECHGSIIVRGNLGQTKDTCRLSAKYFLMIFSKFVGDVSRLTTRDFLSQETEANL